MSNKLAKNVSSDLIADLFETYFAEKVAPFVGIDTFDVTCTKDLQNENAIINVQIYGTAGCPTVEDFKKNRMTTKEINNVTLERYDIGNISFELKPQKTVIVNSNDYLITYESI